MQDNSSITPGHLFQIPLFCLLILVTFPSVFVFAQQNEESLIGDDPQTQKIVENFVTANTKLTEPKILSIYTELFQKAYTTAPEIRIARARKKQKNAQRYTAWARRLAPAVNARLSQMHEFNSDTTDANTADTGTNQTRHFTDGDDYHDWEFTLDLPVYRRPVSVKVDIAEADERLAQTVLRIKTQELDLRLRELLGKYLIATYRLLNLRNSIFLSHKHVEKIYKGYELRDQTRLQLLRAQANLKELEARRDLDEQRREAALRELLDFTGLRQEVPVIQRLKDLLANEVSTAGSINSLAELGQTYGKIREFVDIAKDSTLRQQFLKRSLLCEKINQEQSLAKDKALLHTANEWPGLTVRGLYERRVDTEFNNFEGDGSLALVLSVPLFSGGTIFSNGKAQTMARHIADVTQYADLQETIHAMENNRRLIRSLLNVLERQQILLQQQEEIVILSLKSYAIKQTSMQDLLTSKNRLIDAKNALMETTNTLGTLYRQFAWQLGVPYPLPPIPRATEK